MAKVTGIGGVFFTSKTPDKTAQWYKDALGLEFASAGPDTKYLKFDPHAFAGPVLSIFSHETDYMAPSKKDVMINLIVDDVAQALAQVRAHGGEVIGEIAKESYGDFGWFIDPEGRKIELWAATKPADAAD